MSANMLILDTDGGVDDAQALLMLIAHGRTPDAITTVFGNVGLDVATRNMLDVLAIAGADVPVHMGAAAPMAQPIIDARDVHGEDGLGGAERPARSADPVSKDAIGFLRRTLGAHVATAEKVDLLMIGPLTNLAHVLEAEPGLVAGIGQLTIMGGTVYGRGNTTPAAEFNIFADPEAAAIVFAADINTLVVPWEPCTTHAVEGAELDALLAAAPDGPVKRFQAAISAHMRKRAIGYGRGDVVQMVDPFAAAVVIAPGLVTKSIEAAVEVALAPGVTRGMTVIDPSGRLGTPKVTLVESGDLPQLKALYQGSLSFGSTTKNNQDQTGADL
ncbi:nucleoside hydrolase [Devosia sp.]|uniref:nucleoside hydrolase n=1 Tax=Devosia sp. TaxID=1871048 RepID=UPI003A8CD8C1